MNSDQQTRERVSKWLTGVVGERGGRTIEAESSHDGDMVRLRDLTNHQVLLLGIRSEFCANILRHNRFIAAFLWDLP